MGLTTNYKNSAGIDIGADLVEKSYLIDRYPELVDTFRFAGLWMWGDGSNGKLGDNTVTRKSSPIQTISGGANWKLVTGGQNHTAAVKTDGTLWLWGRNDQGQLGDNTGGSVADKSSPVQTVSGGTNWKQVSCGNGHTAAVKTDGTLWLWGLNNTGQLGQNGVTTRSSPVQTVSGGTTWKLVACGHYHTASVKTDGTLWLWGKNAYYGPLGDNTLTHRSSPIQTVSGGTNWKSVACTRFNTAAIKTDGTLWSWGLNDLGILGDNTITHRSSPVQTVAGGTNWKQVTYSRYNIAAIKTDGTLWLWGHNNFGELGDNTIVKKSSPVQTVSGGTNWKLLASGGYNTSCIKTDGTLWLWGRNNYGQLGDNTVANKSSPIQTVSGGTNWKLVTGGEVHMACIRDDSMDDM